LPSVLFLDEPTVGLDPVARETVWRHIERLRGEFRTTIFMTTHYMEEAEALCSRVGILRDGRLVASGSLGELQAAAGLPAATLESLFARYTGQTPEGEGGYDATAAARRTSQRLA
ncbi:MAG TPA: ABC transporter ATP-binding protein, partial [Ideonella sp.]|nr:ABC transporter ATP-binding protein [Ideonella sp.]